MATTDVFRTLIVPAGLAALAREIAETLKPVAGAGMFQSKLSSTGAEPATHYVSTGYIGPEWEILLPFQGWEEVDGVWTQTDARYGDAVLLHQLLQAEGSSITQSQIVDIYLSADVTSQDPFVAFSRLGLQQVETAEVP